MSPRLATLAFILFILGLFWLDRDKKEKTSPALWIAAAWIFIGASRMVSQWLGQTGMATPEAYVEGSPLDRLILSGLLGAGLLVIASRGRKTAEVLRSNWPVALFFVYCMVSALWSDYPFVSFKRWTKALGNITMVLIVLTDDNPYAALKRLFARTAFFLIPLSVLFIKYYPHLGRGYNPWTWEPYFTGVATEKNALGCIGMIFGLASVWRLVGAVRNPAFSNRGGTILAHGAVIAMAMYVFNMADSSTSLACFFLGSLLIVLMTSPAGRRPLTVHITIGTATAFAVLMFLFQDVWASLVHALGRETTLTGRTDIWTELFQMEINPWVGTGFETFWLGERAQYFWDKYYFHPNQAHNGYIETYINLGWIGVGILALQLTSGYRNVVDGFRRQSAAAPLALAFLIVAIVYNVTEAAFKVMHPVWIAFLFSVTAMPDTSTAEATEEPVPTPARKPSPALAKPRHNRPLVPTTSPVSRLARNG